MKKTALHSKHVALNAKMVPFAGYEMPVMYTGIKEEHKAVRSAVGIFDVSHMANFLIEGADALAFLEHLTVNKVSLLRSGKVQYSAMLNEKGGVLDDILVYCLGSQRFQLIVNASNRFKIRAWIESHLPSSVQFTDRTEQWGILALQGPKAREIFQKEFGASIDSLGVYCVQDFQFEGISMLVSRTGYTGEDGLELFGPNSVMEALWDRLLKNGVVPCGLGSRDTLRLEAGYSLYGHELSEDWDPISSGIAWICPKDKEGFVGEAVLREIRLNGSVYKTVGIRVDEKAIPRQGYTLYKGEYEVGVITSGSQSPTTNEFIAMARVLSQYAEMGALLEVDIRGKRKSVSIVNKRFYTKGA